MIMGYGGTMNLWDPKVLEKLSKKYQVIVFDNRGIGETSIPSGEFTIEQLTNDTARLMAALGIEKAHVMGWSMGTYVAQQLALDHPEKVERLILYAGDCGGKEAIWPDRDVIKVLTDISMPIHIKGAKILKLLFPLQWLKKNFDYVRRVFASPRETPANESIMKQAAAWEKWKGSFSRLAQLNKKTLVITGTEDVLVPPENSTMLAKKIPGAKLIKIKGGGHGLMYQEPDKFSSSVMEFLEEN
jgi:pimeloyl-ACP methyl ester carboxylesterase